MAALSMQVETTPLNNPLPFISAKELPLQPASLGLPYVETPLVKSVILSQQTGVNVWLKFEQAQLSGSFKSRGLGWLVYQTVLNNPGIEYHFFCASGGNAGYAAACAAQQYKQKCTVCLPTTTDPLMAARIEQTGAEVVCMGDTIAQSDNHVNTVLLENARAKGETPFYCHPYDLPLVWEGNSSITDEIVAQSNKAGFRPDALVCSVGGGGLFNGIVQGLQRHGWKDVEMVAVETTGCATLNASLKQNFRVQWDTPKTICSSLATRNVCTQTIEYAKYVQPTHSIVVSDLDAVQASVNFAESHKMLVEPACGAALAPLYTGRMPDHLCDQSKNIVVVVCGGTNITYQKLQQFCRDFNIDCRC